MPKETRDRLNLTGRSVTRRECLALLGKAAGATSLAGLASLAGCGGNAPITGPPPPVGDGYPGTDDQLLEEITRTSFQFFWDQADPATGQVKDRALAAGNDTRRISSIAATGFGLTALCIADQRGYRPSADIVARAGNVEFPFEPASAARQKRLLFSLCGHDYGRSRFQF